ncbi:surface-adhesin E family protein [Dysgonomonas sp. 520]|uniref:surface-adhesin E family protein n=1 Tax=Dysgonomonas sp. 520 TaxID=2302931 RepID=UPI0013D01942|nr:surface-adhesin E family protein [Dysgonomonas sp. 520]NDW08050.1 hypothetical protein [Dysgonomonas sp. 520]
MKKIFLAMIVICLSSVAFAQEVDGWKLFAVTDGVEVYIDTTTIKRVDNKESGTFRYGVVSKKLYTDIIAKSEYLGRIESTFAETEKKPEKVRKKMKKWDDFKYTLIEYIYDCANRRFRTVTITDYNSKGKVIVKTKTKKDSPWTNIEGDDVGDLMLFYVCDSGQ